MLFLLIPILEKKIGVLHFYSFPKAAACSNEINSSEVTQALTNMEMISQKQSSFPRFPPTLKKIRFQFFFWRNVFKNKYSD